MLELVALVALLPSPIDEPQLRREIEGVFKQWSSRWSRKDVDGLVEMLHPDGQTVSADGSVWPFSRAKQDLPAVFAGRRNVKMAIRIDRLERTGSEVVAWITTQAGSESKVGGRWQKSSYTSRDADTLKRFPDGWKFIYSQGLP